MGISGEQDGQAKAPIDWGSVLADLSFIPIISDWLELLASRLAQPMMFIASLWIIAETTVPGADSWSPWLNTLTMTAMSMAPEVISPGCFIQAGRASKEGKENRAKLLFTLFGTCLALLGITIAVAVWHLDVYLPGVTGLILFVRCGVGIAYTVILKIDKESAVVIAQPAPTAQSLPTPEDLAQLIAQSVRSEVQTLAQSLKNDLRNDVQRLVQIAQSRVDIEEIAQDPEPLELGSAQSVRRPRIAQRSTMRNDHEETAQSEPLRNDDEEVCAVEDDDAQNEDTDVVPIAQRETEIVPAMPIAQSTQSDVRSRVFAFLDAHYAKNGPTARITNLEIEKGAPASKNKVVEYRREYDREKRGGV